MKIWALFSIDNMYDQPDNNLIAWWIKKPNFDELCKVFNVEVDRNFGNSKLGKILKGFEVRVDEADYRLEEISEGKYIKGE